MASAVAGSSALGAAGGLTIAGNATALTLHLTHLYTFVKPVWKAASVGDRTVYAYVLGMYSSVVLVVYGATSPPASLPSLTLSVNGVGAALHLFYIVFYLWFSAGRERSRALYLLSAAIATAASVTAMACTRSWGTAAVAAMALLSSASTHLVPAYDVVTTARSGRVDKINPIRAVLSAINGSIWTAYGFASAGGIIYVVVVPNLIGVVCATAQVVVYLMHRGNASQIHAVDDGHDLPELHASTV